MNMLGIVMPVGRSVMYLPDSNSGSSGPWTESDTKVVMVFLIMSALAFLIGVIIELARGFTIGEILSLGGKSDNPKNLTIYSGLITICFYSIWGMVILGYIGYQIYNML